MDAVASVKSVALEATILRADGTREELGRISSYHRNPVRRLVAKLRGQGEITVKKGSS
jgi:hypothetical protein